MKKKAWVLPALLVFLAIAGGAILYLSQYDPSTDESVTLHPVDYTREDVVSVEVQNASGSYTVVTNAESEYGFTCEEIGDLPAVRANYVSLVDAVCSIEAANAYEHEDYSRYGLDDSTTHGKVTLKDGTQYVVTVGDRAPSENFVYFSVDTYPETVFTARMSKFVPLTDNVYALVNRLLAPKTDSPRVYNDETDLADWFRFTNRDGLEFQLVRLDTSYVDGAGNNYRFQQTRPFASYVPGAKVQEHFARLMQFSGSSVKYNHPTPEQIAECGLDNPLTTITIGYGVQESTIHLSPAPNGDYYGLRDGDDVIWNVANYLVTWLDIPARGMLGSYVLAPQLEEVTEVDILVGNKDYCFLLEEGQVKIDNQVLDSKAFEKLYELACSVNSTTSLDGEVGETVARIDFWLKDGLVRSVELRQLGARSTEIYLDGEDLNLVIRQSYSDTLQKACEAIVKGEDFSTSW